MKIAPPSLASWSYSTLVSSLRDGEISNAMVYPDAHMRAIDLSGTPHDVQLLPVQVVNVLDRFADAGVDVTLVPPSALVTTLRSFFDVLPLLVVVLVGWSMLGRMGPMLARMDPNNVSGGSVPDVVDDVSTTFDDVAGLATAKEELFEIVECLRNPERFAASGARTPRGCLLEGPPGTGKTLLARAVAGEANASFIATTASSFVEMYVGLGAARVRSLFKRARECSPCIVWIDEIDAVARQRTSGGRAGGAGNEERETTLNELLSAMDGFEGDTGVIVLAATNRADVLDEALLRPGRFDRRIPVTLPEGEEREEILRVHTRGKQLAADVSLSTLSRQTVGFSGAQLENLMNEAALRALRRSDVVINSADVSDALDRITVGPPRNTTQSRDVRERVAVHEAGHAIVGQTLDNYDNVSRVTIVPRSSGAGGFTVFTPSESRGGLYTRDYLDAELTVLLAGRAAEALVLGEDTISVGASSDLQRARSLAEQMTVEWALDGSVLRDSSDGVSEYTLRRIDERVESLLDDAYSRAQSILNSKQANLLTLAQRLLEEETITTID